MGAFFLAFDSRDVICRTHIYLLSVGSIAMTWELFGLKPYRFGSSKDIGITIYLLILTGWFYLQLPTFYLAPMFFSDPAGACTGKFMTEKLGKISFSNLN